MKTVKLFFIGFIALSFASCAPRVGTMLNQARPPLAANEEVAVYRNPALVPVGSETLGTVKVGDSGFSTKCDSALVIEKIKEESRKAGGNMVLITKHQTPSATSSCHRMNAVIYKVPESVSLDYSQPDSLFFSKKKNVLPVFSIALNGGYGWRTAKIDPALTGGEKDYLKKLKSGFVWDASLNYYFNDSWGIGLIYSSYHAKNDEVLQYMETGALGNLERKDHIYYVGPSFLMRFASGTQWMFNVNAGLGYIGYNVKETFLNYTFKNSGGSVGALISLGVEYKFHENFGIGANLSYISGYLNKMKVDKNGQKGTVKFEDGEGEGLQYLSLKAGIRYYINR